MKCEAYLIVCSATYTVPPFQEMSLSFGGVWGFPEQISASLREEMQSGTLFRSIRAN